MDKVDFNIHCQCPCGAVKLSVRRLPMTRFSCHCTICQSVYNKPYSDETVVFAADVRLEDESLISFRRHRTPPSAKRGICSQCKSPVVAFISLAPMLKVAIIPHHIYQHQNALQASKAHIFYHRRVTNVEDKLPKYSGYLASQLAAMRLIMLGVLGEWRQSKIR